MSPPREGHSSTATRDHVIATSPAIYLPLASPWSMIENSRFAGAFAKAGVRASRGGPGQWGFVNLVRAGTQQP